MSPQEFLAAQKQQAAARASESPSEGSEQEEAPEQGEASETAQEAAESPLEASDEDFEEEDEEEPEEGRQDPYQGAEDEPEEEDSEEEEEDSETSPKSERKSKNSEEESEIENIDYKTEYERLFAPLKASKREVKIKSVDDARNLMQMGVDYAKKMQTLRPQLKILKTLEKNNLLAEDKINFLIDLDKKNPEAIKKFLKEKEIDPMDLDLSEEAEYKPKSYMPTDKEAAIDEVLDQIRETPSFNRTVDELGNKWDDASKQIIFENPQLIAIINDQIANGMYDQIMSAVETERMLGRLQGLNDLMAYKQIGDALQKQNAFKHLETGSKPERKQSQDPKLKARKRAASPTRRSSVTTAPPKMNPLSMSDEDFEKMGVPSFG